MNKKFMYISFVSLFLISGCDKKNEGIKEGLVPVEIKGNELTNEEINQLNLIAQDANTSTSTRKLAQIYLNDPNAYKVEDIKVFIVDYFNQQAELEEENNSINLEYNIDTYNFRGYSQHSLNILSLSDNVDIDRVEVNRGNCETVPLAGSKSILNYGESKKLFLRCDPWSVREVKVYLANGQNIMMTPKE